jgi:hypothetical protein
VRERRVIPVYSFTRVHITTTQTHTRLRVQRASGVPHALCFQGESFSKASGDQRREGEVVSKTPSTSLRGAQRRSNLSLRGAMDCFVAALLAMTAERSGMLYRLPLSLLGHSVWVPAFAGTTAVLVFTHAPIRRMALIFLTRCR